VREFVEPRVPVQRISWGALFYRKDGNQDGRLSLEEWQVQPAAPLSDPVSELARAITDAAAAQWEEADKDGNGELSERDWRSVHWEDELLSTILTYPELDLDRDRALTLPELQLAVEVLYGVRRPADSASLRYPDGFVINCVSIQQLDIDQDWRITRDEFIERFYEGPLNAQRFSELDHDGNGVLDDADLLERRVFALDTLWDFCRIDQDFNGRLSHEEIVTTAHAWQQQMCGRLLRAYDENADGALDLREYQLTPFANPMIEWYYGFRDADDDGQLSWAEYRQGPSQHFPGLMRSVYEHFDADRDGVLSLREYDFSVNVERVPLETAFGALDRDEDGALELSDATGLERPDGNDPTVILRWEERMMQVDEAFASADEDGDGRILPEEFRDHRGEVAAALTGQAPPSAPLSLTSTAAASEGVNWRLIGLIACNVLLLAGIGWYVLRGSAG
jgi:Ca2+-binding EF-hand superfamily protein